MRLTVQKRLAAQMLKCSKKKIWIDPERLEEVKEAITKQDLNDLIKQGLIEKKRIPQQSKGRARVLKIQKKKGRGKGKGRRKGKSTARTPAKKTWMANVRAQRALLRNLREKGIIEKKTCSELLRKVKGGFFRSRRHIKIFLSDRRLLKLEEKKKAEPVEKTIPKKEKPAEKKAVKTKKAGKKTTIEKK